jgi:hypothetical protein
LPRFFRFFDLLAKNLPSFVFSFEDIFCPLASSEPTNPIHP